MRITSTARRELHPRCLEECPPKSWPYSSPETLERAGFCATLSDNQLRRVFAEQRQAVLHGAIGTMHQAALAELDFRGIDYRTTTPLHVQTSAQPEPRA